MRALIVTVSILTMTWCAAPSAEADLTALVGANLTPSNRPVQGFAAGLSLLVIGFEFEYSNTKTDDMAGAPGLRTGMLNLLVQTPFWIAGMQFYGTVGGGVYRESGGGLQETNTGGNTGFGVKIALAGPLRMRLDYRVFTLRGSPQFEKHHRLYAGLNLGF